MILKKNDPIMLPWRKEAMERGSSVMAVPIKKLER
jgi:hypothetical protein